MRVQLVKTISATLAATSYPVASYGTPFLRGNDCVLMLSKDGDWAGGAITIKTDNSVTSSGAAAWETIQAASDMDAATTEMIHFYNVNIGDNIEITAVAPSAGTCSVFLLGDS